MENKNIAATIISLVLIAGCTGQTGALTSYSSQDYGIAMGHPSDWTVNEQAEGIVVAFTSPLESKDDAFKESVNIVMNDISDQNLDLEAYTEIVLQSIASNFPDALITEAKDITVDGNQARMIVYTREGQYGKLKFMQVWTIVDGISYIITYTAQDEKFDTYRPVVDTMVESFKISSLAPNDVSAEPQKEPAVITADSNAVGSWRAYSERIYYDSGGSNYLDTATTRKLEIYNNGKWEFGTSGGTWEVKNVEDADWEKWVTNSYGPTRKIVLNGWNNGIGDGPIEETEARVDFLWLIYRAEPPTVSSPAQIQIKFGHTSG